MWTWIFSAYLDNAPEACGTQLSSRARAMDVLHSFADISYFTRKSNLENVRDLLALRISVCRIKFFEIYGSKNLEAIKYGFMALACYILQDIQQRHAVGLGDAYWHPSVIFVHVD